MSSITVAVFLVHCAADVLVCDTVQSERMRYSSMENCQSEVAQLLSERNRTEDSGLWMGKCVYRLSSADPRRTRRDLASDGSRVLKSARNEH